MCSASLLFLLNAALQAHAQGKLVAKLLEKSSPKVLDEALGTPPLHKEGLKAWRLLQEDLRNTTLKFSDAPGRKFLKTISESVPADEADSWLADAMNIHKSGKSALSRSRMIDHGILSHALTEEVKKDAKARGYVTIKDLENSREERAEEKRKELLLEEKNANRMAKLQRRIMAARGENSSAPLLTYTGGYREHITETPNALLWKTGKKDGSGTDLQIGSNEPWQKALAHYGKDAITGAGALVGLKGLAKWQKKMDPLAVFAQESAVKTRTQRQQYQEFKKLKKKSYGKQMETARMREAAEREARMYKRHVESLRKQGRLKTFIGSKDSGGEGYSIPGYGYKTAKASPDVISIATVLLVLIGLFLGSVVTFVVLRCRQGKAALLSTD